MDACAIKPQELCGGWTVEMAGQGLVDIRTLVRAPDFVGSEDGWKEWAFALKSFAGLLELDDLLDSVVDAGTWDNDLRDKSGLLCHLLVQLLRGKAVSSYEDQASSRLGPVVKCATVLRYAPPEVRHVLRVSADRLGHDYRAMSDFAPHIRSFRVGPLGARGSTARS